MCKVNAHVDKACRFHNGKVLQRVNRVMTHSN